MNTLQRTVQLYRTQFELLWRWRAGRWALLKRAFIALLAALIAFYVTAWLLPGQLLVASLAGGLAAVVIIAALNLLVRPILIVFVASRSVVALVLLTLLFQVFVFWLLGPLVSDVIVTAGLIGLLLVSFVFGFLQAGISALFGLGEEDSYYGTLVRTMASRQPAVTRTDEPGLVIIQVDGLSHDVMSHSVRAGRVPEMSSWIRSGSHKLGHWDALLPSTTPASQAGILHGNNDGIPNFRWWEKKERRLLVANHPEDATIIERRISDGAGLLSPGGASISNIFTGDADRAFLVMSTIKVKERGLGQSDAFAWFFVSPYNYMVMGAKYVAEVVKERVQSWRQQRAGMVPHMGHHRGFPYPLVRAATNVALRALGTSLIIQEMVRGTPVIYMDYTDYDEIAHHSGPERPESLDALDGVDRELRTLKKAAEEAARPYRFVILADHGQSLGQTFLQRYGVAIQDVVRSLMGGQASVAAATAQVEDWGQLNTFLGEVSETKGVSGSLARAVTHDRRSGEQVELGPQESQFTPAGAPTATAAGKGDKAAQEEPEPADLIVVAGGNLALIYFDVSDERMTLGQTEDAYPDLIQGLVAHPGIGILMVRTADHGAIAIGKHGVHFLDEDRVEGTDPLAPYGEMAVAALKRLDGIANVGDIALVSVYDPETGEIAAFEELIGAHGGLGGPQTRPFLLYPADWEIDEGPLVGAPAVYRQLRRWMEQHLGMTFGPHTSPAPKSEPSTAAGPPAAAETPAAETPAAETPAAG
jgi:uncharacterized membrane protein YvlD (DUF360 family)